MNELFNGNESKVRDPRLIKDRKVVDLAFIKGSLNEVMNQEPVIGNWTRVDDKAKNLYVIEYSNGDSMVFFGPPPIEIESKVIVEETRRVKTDFNLKWNPNFKASKISEIKLREYK